MQSRITAVATTNVSSTVRRVVTVTTITTIDDAVLVGVRMGTSWVMDALDTVTWAMVAWVLICWGAVIITTLLKKQKEIHELALTFQM